MTTTWATIIDRCESSLADSANAEWTTTEIARWVNDFVRDYSQHFPLIKTHKIDCTAGTQAYDLPADYLGMVSVEYPDGEDPPAYLSRLVQTHPAFWTGDKWFDVIAHDDDTDPNELIISADDAVATEDIIVTYQGHHALIADPASISGNTTIPPVHQPLIVKYVLWQATLKLLFAEQVSPTSNSSLLMSQYSQTARRLENSYHTALRQALYAADGESRPVSWIGEQDYSAKNSLGRVY